MTEIEDLRQIIADQTEAMGIATDRIDRATRMIEGLRRTRDQWKSQARLLASGTDTAGAAVLFECAGDIDRLMREMADGLG